MDIELKNISKKYTYKTVLNGVSVKFEKGKIHALLGENGAGKSTLAKILSGALHADSGDIYLDEKNTFIANERDALQKGIAIVQQRPLLAESISVYENIILGAEYNFPSHTKNTATEKISKKELLKNITDLKNKIVPELDLKSLVRDIGGDERFFTSLISALLHKPKVMILDEPSALLDWNQRRQLYAYIREFAKNGMNVIIITHSREEAALYTDTITILDKGIVKKNYDDSKLFGNDIQTENGKQKNENGKMKDENCGSRNSCGFLDNSQFSIFNFQLITVRPKNRPALFDINFTAKAGEITLITGLTESGLSTLENVLTGMEHTKTEGFLTIQTAHTENDESAAETEIKFASKKYTPKFLRKNLNAAVIPTDRNFRAANPNLTIAQMLTAMYDKNDIENYADKLIEKAGVNIKRTEKVSSLSGGMLQRLIIARELEKNPNVIIACEPLQGLDPEVTNNICRLLSEHAKKGAAVIVISTAGFPEEICSSCYYLDGGKLFPKLINQHKNNHIDKKENAV